MRMKMKLKLNRCELMDLFSKKNNKTNILWEALDYMQQYNGRSKEDCIALALGFDIRWDDDLNTDVYVKGDLNESKNKR